MPNISFASGGDSETLDYIAYVAKDSPGGPVPARACYVLECGGGLAQDVITTIGRVVQIAILPFKSNQIYLRWFEGSNIIK